MQRAVRGLALLAALTAMTGADAQSRRMPVRADPIPDTESGRPAASAERPTFKGRMIIYGPPVLPLGAPPEHIKPAPAIEPVAIPTPDPAPTPVATPKPVPTPPAPIAAPLPAPTPTSPPAQIAVPAPTPPPAPVAVVPVPTPPPAPAAAAPAPVVAAPAQREPIVREPVVRSEPVRSDPARPAAPLAPPRQEVALAAPSTAPAAPVAIDAKLIESIFFCLSPGLPQDWKRAWVEITDQGSGKEKNSRFRVSNILESIDEGEPLVPCNARELTGRIVGLNDRLPPDRRAWTRALLVIDSDGEYELTYEYAK